MELRSFWARLFVTFCVSCSAYALPAQDLSDLPRQVEEFLQQEMNPEGTKRVEISVKRPDPRLRLNQCDKELTFSNKTRNTSVSHITVQVACEGNRPWSFFVSAQIKQWATIVVASSDLNKGHILTSNDLNEEQREISRLSHGFYQDKGSIIGMAVKRMIKKDEAVRSALITPPRLVNKGDQVTIIASNGNVSVRIAGEALAHGKQGQQIKVRNSHSERIIKAQVTGKGTVKVLM